jgi:hypothetical protein
MATVLPPSNSIELVHYKDGFGHVIVDGLDISAWIVREPVNVTIAPDGLHTVTVKLWAENLTFRAGD